MKVSSVISSLLTVALFLATSCIVSDLPLDPDTPTPGLLADMAEVSFTAEMPAPKAVATRAVGAERENVVVDIHVLVFEKGADGALIYKGKGKNLTASDGATNRNRVTFKATLPVGTACDFMVLANAESLLAGIEVGSGGVTKSHVAALTRTLAGKWSASATSLDPVPMWGELRDRTLTATSEITFPLTRMLARVNVEYKPTAGTDDNFQLTSVRVYNYSTRGTLVPAAASLDTDGITSLLPTAPAAGYGTPPATSPAPLVYSGADITDDKKCEGLIYLLEAAHNGYTYKSPGTNDDWRFNPCLVIGGRFKADGAGGFSSGETFYRVDFIQKTTTGGVTTDQWLSVLRNFSYNVTITEVSGGGYSTPEIALNSAPFGLEANILPWNERDGRVVYDGAFYLWLSRDEFVFQRLGETGKRADRANVFEVMTDYMVEKNPRHEKSGWHVDRIVAAGTDTPVTWLTLVPGKRDDLTWAKDQKNEVYFTFTTNPGPENRQADVWIKAGRLEYKVRVVQKIASLDVLDDLGAAVSEMAFVIPDTGTDGTETRPFKVTWTPAGQPVTITGRNQANGAFDPSWITGTPAFPSPAPYGSANPPDTSTIPAQSGSAVGEQLFAVKPAAVTTAMLTADPFYETNTTYYFQVENSGEVMTDSLNLRQIHYGIKADTQKYRLDGGVHTLTVRSNADWEIVAVDEHLFGSPDPTPTPPDGSPIMIDFGYAYDNMKAGLRFGPNVNGTALSFHVVNNESGAHKAKWGTVWVTLRMTTPQNTTKTIRVPMQFPPATRLILGLGPGLDVRGYNIGIPTAYHLNSAYRMVSSPYNFGSMDESIYKVEGLRVLGYNVEGASAANPSTINPDFDWHKNSLRDWLNLHSPDVIVVSSRPGEPLPRFNANEIRLFKEYLDHGGALIMCSHAGVGQFDAGTRTAALMSAIFGTTFTSSDINYDGDTGQTMELFSGDSLASDPIVKGPFGDIRGKHWGAHYYTTGVKTSLLPSTVVTLSTQVDTSGRGSATVRANEATFSTVFHDTDPKNRFMYIGNGCVMASYYDGINEGYHDPFDIDDNMYPTYEVKFGPQGDTNVTTGYWTNTCNAFMIANAIAWALDRTNHMPPPSPGYE